MDNNTAIQTRPTLYLMMGGPASGKGTMISKTSYLNTLAVVDCDTFKAEHPDYDPKNITQEVHDFSIVLCERAFFAALGTGASFIYDGTGCNAEKYVAKTAEAHAAGYNVEVVYVTCSMASALIRNAGRDRSVPENLLRDKYSTIATSFEIISRYVDGTTVINND
jgi:predicted kinase